MQIRSEFELKSRIAELGSRQHELTYVLEQTSELLSIAQDLESRESTCQLLMYKCLSLFQLDRSEEAVGDVTELLARVRELGKDMYYQSLVPITYVLYAFIMNSKDPQLSIFENVFSIGRTHLWQLEFDHLQTWFGHLESQCLSECGHSEAALVIAKESLEEKRLNPESTGCDVGCYSATYAIALSKLDRDEEAETFLRDSLRRDTPSADLLIECAHNAWRLAKPEDALRFAYEARGLETVSDHPKKGATLIGDLRFACGAIEEAEFEYAVASHKRNTANLSLRQALVFVSLNDTQASLAELTTGVDGEDEPYYATKCELVRCALFGQPLRDSPPATNSNQLKLLRALLCDELTITQSMDSIQQRNIDPADKRYYIREAMCLRGMQLERLGQRGEAREMYSKILEGKPELQIDWIWAKGRVEIRKL